LLRQTGNFHATVLYNPRDTERARTVIRKVQRAGIAMGGTISGEHGIGLENREMLCEELGMEYVDAMRRLKLAWDPLCLLNPDKIFKVRWETESVGEDKGTDAQAG
jgi:D-lactate dehydrogenase (cytochrome)